jgi:DNA-binding NarL/FixJ family response regulator
VVEDQVTERIRDLRDRPAPERDPTVRRRLPTEDMMRRDAQIARLLRAGLSYRQVAARLGCSLGSVQKSVRRTRDAKRATCFDE